MSPRHLRCSSTGRVTAKLLLSFVVLSPTAVFGYGSVPDSQKPVLLPPIQLPGDAVPGPAVDHHFTLKHIFHHGTYEYPDLHRRLDISAETPLWVMTEDEFKERQPAPVLKAQAAPLRIERLADRRRTTIDSILEVGRMTGTAVDLPLSAWSEDEIRGPNVTDKKSVLTFARMAADAYVVEPGSAEWQNVKGGFNYTEDFGWESDGLRGHIFADTENRTVVIGLKGTSPAVFDGSETTTNDKVNDNLFFSCCCGQGGQLMWRRVCDCQTDTYSCNSTCLVGQLRAKNRYYYASQDLYHNVTALYPSADIWITGHSLGGSVGSMLGLTFGLPVITFEAVPDAMAASRLGLPVPPGHQVGAMQARSNTGGFHFGHTADPVYMGLCNTATAVCTIAGYAMQSMCHTGLKCVYDTVKDKGWRVGIGTHKIVSVISDVLEKYDSPPKCESHSNCTDCFNWNFYESNGTESTTSMPTTTTSYSRTRTSTCKTPGWWGCLDESTTEDSSWTSSTSFSSTSSCKTPGWFGCLDESTTTTMSSSKAAQPAPTLTTTSLAPTTTSCADPGWFGCNDPTTALLTSSSASSTIATSTSTSTTCRSKWFGLICDDSHTTDSAKV